jgi:uncharacterized protein YdeI (YjbR/CyaY-like superfamily)
MEMTHTFHAPDRAAWRRWLEEHHAAEKDVWLVYYKGQAQPCITYEESVEEALCFGWVDSLIQKIDEDRYARKFTPRRPGSVWSETNKRRLARVIEQGRITPAGMAAVNFPLDSLPPTGGAKPASPPLEIPNWMETALRTSTTAWRNFSNLPPSHKKRYLAWLSSAKKEETRQKNLKKAIEMLERDQRLEMKTRTGH